MDSAKYRRRKYWLGAISVILAAAECRIFAQTQGVSMRATNGLAYNSIGIPAPALVGDFQSLHLNDRLGVTSINFNNRQLSDSSGTLCFSWGSPSNVSPVSMFIQNGYVSLPTVSRVLIGNSAGTNELNSSFDTEDVCIGHTAGMHLLGTYNSFVTAIGSDALGNMTNGSGAVAIGQKAFVDSTNVQASVAIGSKAGANLPFPLNDTFIGYGAAENTTTTTPSVGSRTFIGLNSGLNYNGEQCTFIGAFTAANNSGTGNNNVGIGVAALQNINNGSQNVAIGANAMLQIQNTGGSVGIGFEALQNSSDQYNLTAIGQIAGLNNTGQHMTFIGASSGVNNQGSYSILIGDSAGHDNQVSHVLIVGGDNSSAYITNAWIGGDAYSGQATNYPIVIQGTDGSGTDRGGAKVTLAGGRGTGAASGGDLALATALPGSSGTNENAYSTQLLISGARATVTVIGQLVLNQTTNTPVNTNTAKTWFLITNGTTAFYVPGFQ